MPGPKRKLDTVVKLGLSVLVGSFALIWGGMFLTRPDRSIPPYSIGSQEGTAGAVHVPGWTIDSAIETLIDRFRKIGGGTRDFGKMKIRPTTPGDPGGRYRRITIYIFTHDSWAEPEILRRYLMASSGEAEDRAVKEAFEKAVRGFYRLDETQEEGRIGPLLSGKDSAATAAYSRELFKGPVTSVTPKASYSPAQAGVAGTTRPSPSPSPVEPADRGL
ncbi:MAG TPA: hypothetical protein VEU07_12870 [Candidatus Acidoferrum sp.]|nr:hypothetical protein [Candidatus Acidoferrum sp.]